MRITLLACTRIEIDNFFMSTQRGDVAADVLAEFAGRACYQSFDKPNPNTRTNKDYLANILRLQHLSVLEHAYATFYVEGVSRVLGYELLRHHHLKRSELSQRYVDMSYADMITHPQDPNPSDQGHDEYFVYLRKYDSVLRSSGSKKLAADVARYHLPGGIETKFVLSGNHRAYRDMIQKRNIPEANEEIRMLAQELLKELKRIAPNTYQDMEP